MSTDVRKQFLKDVAAFEMTVVRDNGVNRHLRFSEPGNCNNAFDIVTWPWRLCYTGDMGTYVFTRLEDMFVFFRRPGANRGVLWFDAGYWAEKALAEDRNGAIRVYSEERFRTVVKDWIFNRERKLPGEVIVALRERLLHGEFSNEHEARDAVDRFNCDYPDFQFTDFYEIDIREHSYRFLWCCCALAWGIAKYDEARARKPEASQKVTEETKG